MKAVGIKWDTDGDRELRAMLPKEKRLPDSISDYEEASDWLSDVTGFCHFGFFLEIEKSDLERVLKDYDLYSIEITDEDVAAVQAAVDAGQDVSEAVGVVIERIANVLKDGYEEGKE